MKRTRRQRVMGGRWAPVVVPLSLLLGLATTIAFSRVRTGMALFVPPGTKFQLGHLSGKGFSPISARHDKAASHYAGWLIGPLVAEYRTLTADQWRERIVECLEGVEEIELNDPFEEIPPGDIPTGDAAVVSMDSTGWPLRSFYSLTAEFDPIVSGGVRQVVASTDERSVLPFARGRVLWWPLAANTAMIAAMWAVPLTSLLVLFLAARRTLRIQRDRCTNCNYDRAGIAKDAVCPECGKLSRG